MQNKYFTFSILAILVCTTILVNLGCNGDSSSTITTPITTASATTPPATTTPMTTPPATTTPTTTAPATTPPVTTAPATTAPATTAPANTTPVTTTPAEEPEPVPGVPVLLSPDNRTIFSIEETVEFEWESGEGGIPTGYKWEIEYTDPVENARFGYWENDDRLYFHEEFTSDITNVKMSSEGWNAGRWRVKALNQTGESDWSEWYYFGFGEPVQLLNIGLVTWEYATYYCFSPVEAGDTITIDAGFWSTLGTTGTWFVQLVDPGGNIERSWASCTDSYPFYSPCEDPAGMQTTCQVLQSGLYSIRIIVTKSPGNQQLNVSVRVNPISIDRLNFFVGHTNPGWHLVK